MKALMMLNMIKKSNSGESWKVGTGVLVFKGANIPNKIFAIPTIKKGDKK
jgi:hypothetical protein